MFEVRLSAKALKDLAVLDRSNPEDARKILGLSNKILSESPYPFTKAKKKIKGLKYPTYRLRIDAPGQSYRIFYGITGNIVLLLRIVPKKEADRIISSLKKGF